MGLPSALQNRIKQTIDAVEMVEATDVNISIPRPVGGKFGAAGLIGIFKGQALVRVDVTFAQVADKSQFEFFASTLTNFKYTFTKGSSTFMLLHCELGDGGIRNNYESGDTSVTSTFVGVGPKKVS